MTNIYKLNVDNNDLLETVNAFFKKLLKAGTIDALLVPQEVPTGKSVVQTLVRNEEELKSSNPFSPLLLMNSARMVSQLTMKNPKEKIGAVMRSCEVRAAIELAKLKQVNLDSLVIIGVDCMGTYESTEYREISNDFKNVKELTGEFISTSHNAQAKLLKGRELRTACRGCEHPACENADVAINFLGCDAKKEIFIQLSEKMSEIDPKTLGLEAAESASQWEKAIEGCRSVREKFSDKLFQEVLEITKDIKGYIKELEHCRRCYNCRKECPICYCRECIFDSQVFEHAPKQYINWAERKGKIRMPTDTLLFHLTRMNHMVVSCVACGQCTSACPNGVPVAKFFKTVGAKVQKVFDYKPGENVEEEIPQSIFKEEEFPEIGEAPKK